MSPCCKETLSTASCGAWIINIGQTDRQTVWSKCRKLFKDFWQVIMNTGVFYQPECSYLNETPCPLNPFTTTKEANFINAGVPSNLSAHTSFFRWCKNNCPALKGRSMKAFPMNCLKSTRTWPEFFSNEIWRVKVCNTCWFCTKKLLSLNIFAFVHELVSETCMLWIDLAVIETVD